MKSPANMTLGRKLARKYMRSTCTIKRKGSGGWFVVAANEPISIEDSSDRPMRPDGYDAGTDNVRTWNIMFREGVDIEMQDQLHDIVDLHGEPLPIMTVATNFETDLRTGHWVVCQAEDSAVAKEWIAFFREHDDETTTGHGPYPCTVDWDDISGTDPDNFNASAHLTSCVLTGPADMNVRLGDFPDAIDGRKGGVVIEVRKPVGNRREVKVRIDSGARDL